MALRRWTVLLLAVCFVHFKGNRGQESETSRELEDEEHNSRARLTVHLLSLYHPLVIPVTPVNVTYDLNIRNIDGVDEKENVLRIAVFVIIQWFDHRFRWDPAGFNGIDSVSLPANKIWRPDLRPYAQVLESEEVKLRVYSSGTIFHVHPMRLAIPCHMRLVNYPFDFQTCNVEVASWSYDASMINLSLPVGGSQGDGSSQDWKHPLWAIESVTADKSVLKYACCSETYVSVTFRIQMKRQLTGYTARVLAPSVVTSLLLLLCFLVPPTSGERIILCSVLLLCILLQLFQLNLIVPLSGPDSPFLGDFLCFSVFLAFFAAIESVLTFNLSRGMWGGGNTGQHDDGELFGVQKESKPGMPRIARFIDVGCFVVFTFIFAIAGGVILNPRTE